MAKKVCSLLNLGMMNYSEALELQYKLVDMRQKNLIDDVLILLEHSHVVTMGRRATDEVLRYSRQELKKMGVDVCGTNRGGSVTYHGPGQIIGYPIMRLEHGKLDVKEYMDKLVEVMARTVGDYSIDSFCKKGLWCRHDNIESKIGATGAALMSRNGVHVTMHGFALNVNTDLKYFTLIEPCGSAEQIVISMEKILGKKLDMNDVRDRIVLHFRDVFGYSDLNETSIEELF